MRTALGRPGVPRCSGRLGAALAFAVACALLCSSCFHKGVGPGPFAVSIGVSGHGHVSGAESGLQPGGKVISLAPVADPGWVFASWSGPSASKVADNALTVTGDESLTALFVQPLHPNLDMYRPDQPTIGPGPAGSWDDGFVADPFVFTYGGKAWIFYEGASVGGPGSIGVAESGDGVHFAKWASNPVLSTGLFHLSYPQVFEYGDYLYMHVTPGGDAMYLYRTTPGAFPAGWRLVRQTVTVGLPGAWDEDEVYDGTIYQMSGAWWMLYGGRDHTGRSRIGLAVARGGDFANGKWQKWDGDGSPTPLYPAGSGWPTGQLRMGGSVVPVGGMPFFFFQGASRADIHLYDSRNDQQEGVGYVSLPGSRGALTWHLGAPAPGGSPVPVLSATSGRWDGLHIHQLSVAPWEGQYLAVYDGQSQVDGWRIGAMLVPNDALELGR